MRLKLLLLASFPVALVASCTSSVMIGTAEALMSRNVSGPLFFDGPWAVVGLALAATSIALPVTLLALWSLIIPVTIALDRNIGRTVARNLTLVALGAVLGMLITQFLALDLRLLTDALIGPIYGFTTCLLWVFALHRLDPSARNPVPDND